MSQRGLVRGLGFLTLTALLAGNVIGSGIYVTPGSLAGTAGPVALVAWLIVAVGYLPLTFVYGDMGRAYPITGGPQVFAGRAFGSTAGVVCAFLYWVGAWTANAAFITAFTGYFAVFFPSFQEPLRAFLLAQVLLWGLALVNILGVKVGGVVAFVTTTLKILPLIVLAVALYAVADPGNLQPFAPHGYGAILPSIGLVAWLFVGAESVTVPAEEVKDSGPTIRRAAFAGYALAAGLYVVVALALSLGIPSSAIAGSASPLAIAAETTIGPWGTTLITAGALVSILGILNGWTLVVGRVPFAAAREGAGPAWFGALHPRYGTPARGILVSTLPAAILASLYFSHSLLGTYELVTLASTALTLGPVAAACAAQLVLMRREPGRFPRGALRWGPVTASLGCAVALLMIYAAGWVAMASLAIVAVLPVPFHLLMRRTA